MVNDETAVMDTTETPVEAAPVAAAPVKDDPYADSMILQCRGFPFSIEKEEVLEFLGISEDQIESFVSVCGTNGKPAGECFIIAAGEEPRDEALKRHKQTYKESERYVDVFKSSEVYYHRRVSINQQYEREWDGIVRLRGLPFQGDAKEMIETFFEGISWVAIHPINNKSGKSTGEAYVEFSSFSDASNALEKNKETIGDRYIEVFQSSNNELRSALLAQAKLAHHSKWSDKNIKGQMTSQVRKRQAQQGGGANGSAQAPEDAPETKVAKQEAVEPVVKKQANPYPHIVNMSGVPDGSVASEIQKFFRPHRAIAVNVKSGGEVDVAFKTHDAATNAMEKDGEEFKGANVSLTLSSEP